MKALVGIAALATVWLVRIVSPAAEDDPATARAEAAVRVANARLTSGRATAVGPAVPRLELPVEPPAIVDANPELPPADPRTIYGAIYELGGDPCVGATVVAISPALQGEQVVITDEDGSYIIPGLPPGAYTLVVFYNNEQLSVAGYEVRDDEPTLAELVFDPLPRDDVASDKSPSQIDEVYVVETLGPPEAYENVPTGRSFADALDCPEGGCTIHSDCSTENTYVVTGDDEPSDGAITVPTRTFETVMGASAGSQPGG